MAYKNKKEQLNSDPGHPNSEFATLIDGLLAFIETILIKAGFIKILEERKN